MSVIVNAPLSQSTAAWTRDKPASEAITRSASAARPIRNGVLVIRTGLPMNIWSTADLNTRYTSGIADWKSEALKRRVASGLSGRGGGGGATGSGSARKMAVGGAG